SLGYRLTAVAEPLEPPEMFEWFVALRRGMGMTVVPLGPEAGTAVLGCLRANGVAALVSDRDLVGNGVEVEFFGERTTLPAGPATASTGPDLTGLPSSVEKIRPSKSWSAPPTAACRASVRPPQRLFRVCDLGVVGRLAPSCCMRCAQGRAALQECSKV